MSGGKDEIELLDLPGASATENTAEPGTSSKPAEEPEQDPTPRDAQQPQEQLQQPEVELEQGDENGDGLQALSCTSYCLGMFNTNGARKMVSQNRNRFVSNKWNLDLSYITDRIIAMGFPASMPEKFYRNSIDQTVAFLEARHKDHYKVFNLRGGKLYNPRKFNSRVISFEMKDHHPPSLELMAPFCREAHEWLQADHRNVIAVHCKAGKGRTGVMICAYLSYIKFYNKPRLNLDYYSIVRTENNKGVTIPSQRRYIYYFNQLRENKLNYFPLRMQLMGVYFERPPRLTNFYNEFGIKIQHDGVELASNYERISWTTSQWEAEEAVWKDCKSTGDDSFDPQNGNQDVSKKYVISRRAFGWTVPADGDGRIFVEGDVRIDLTKSSKVRAAEKTGHIWFNTMFACRKYCNNVLYRHGDEADPYKDGEAAMFKTTVAGGDGQSDYEREKGPLPPPEKPLVSCLSKKPKKKDPKGKKGRAETAVSNGNEKVLLPMAMLPPDNLHEHVPQQTLIDVYDNKKMHRPRDAINQILRRAQRYNLIVDDYNNARRLSEPDNKAKSVPCGGTDKPKPKDAGPCRLVRESDEHVLVFPYLEIDRAEKHNLGEQFKMYVVLKCVRKDTENMSEAFSCAVYRKMKEEEERKEREEEEKRQKEEEEKRKKDEEEKRQKEEEEKRQKEEEERKKKEEEERKKKEEEEIKKKEEEEAKKKTEEEERNKAGTEEAGKNADSDAAEKTTDTEEVETKNDSDEHGGGEEKAAEHEEKDAQPEEEVLHLEQNVDPVDQKDAQLEQKDAPVQHSDAPVEHNDAPVEQKDVPVEQNDVPVEQNDAPAEQNDAPAEQYDAPAEQNDAPAEQNDAPAEQNDAPLGEEVPQLELENGLPEEENVQLEVEDEQPRAEDPLLRVGSSQPAAVVSKKKKDDYMDVNYRPGELGAERCDPSLILYGGPDGMIGANGGQAANLESDLFKDDCRAKDDKYCKYFYRQSRKSLSRYPPCIHTCGLTGIEAEVCMREFRLDTEASRASEKATKIGASTSADPPTTDEMAFEKDLKQIREDVVKVNKYLSQNQKASQKNDDSPPSTSSNVSSDDEKSIEDALNNAVGSEFEGKDANGIPLIDESSESERTK